MTSKLPFGLTTKPTRRYIDGYSISFSVTNGKLFCIVTHTTKLIKTRLSKFEVTTKEMLDKILKVESFSELQTIEVVN